MPRIPFLRNFFYLILCFSLSSAIFAEEKVPPLQHEELSTPNTFQQWENQEDSEAKPEEAHFQELFLRTILLLGLLVGFLFASSWILRKMQFGKFMQSNKGAEIQLLEKKVLSNKTCVWLIEVRDIQMAVGESQQGLEILHKWQQEKEI